MATENNARAGFEAAAEHRREASLSASVSQRLRWLEEAWEFARKVGAFPRRDADPAPSSLPK